MNITQTQLPDKSQIKTYLPANYEDTFCCKLDSATPLNATTDDLMVSFWTQSPKSVQTLFEIRNKLVKLVGLKGETKDNKLVENCIRNGVDYEMFSLAYKDHKETILKLSDKHLSTYISILKEQNKTNTLIYVSTIVHLHNTLGYLYFYPIIPFHKIVVKNMMKYTISRFIQKIQSQL